MSEMGFKKVCIYMDVSSIQFIFILQIPLEKHSIFVFIIAVIIFLNGRGLLFINFKHKMRYNCYR